MSNAHIMRNSFVFPRMALPDFWQTVCATAVTMRVNQMNIRAAFEVAAETALETEAEVTEEAAAWAGGEVTTVSAVLPSDLSEVVGE